MPSLNLTTRRTMLWQSLITGLAIGTGCHKTRRSTPAEREQDAATIPRPTLKQYLLEHEAVRQAMVSLDGSSYDSWQPRLKTKLYRFYDALSIEQQLPLSYQGAPPTISINRVERS